VPVPALSHPQAARGAARRAQWSMTLVLNAIVWVAIISRFLLVGGEGWCSGANTASARYDSNLRICAASRTGALDFITGLGLAI
jgi:hypothetical protein